jgi:hypothetical protein
MVSLFAASVASASSKRRGGLAAIEWRQRHQLAMLPGVQIA